MIYQEAAVAEEAEIASQSMLSWMFSALGPVYLLLIPAAGFVGFLLALIIVMRGKGPLAGAALLLVVHVPLLIGIFAALQGMLYSFSVAATSATAPEPAELASGISLALYAPLVALFVMIPAYITAFLGAFVRCLKAPAE